MSFITAVRYEETVFISLVATSRAGRFVTGSYGGKTLTTAKNNADPGKRIKRGAKTAMKTGSAKGGSPSDIQKYNPGTNLAAGKF
jgi:hypothetical protein